MNEELKRGREVRETRKKDLSDTTKKREKSESEKRAD